MVVGATLIFSGFVVDYEKDSLPFKSHNILQKKLSIHLIFFLICPVCPALSIRQDEDFTLDTL
jgi:hypothetical protein